MGLGKDTSRSESPMLMVAREPVGPNNAAVKKTVGDTALRDALIMVGIAWAILFFLVWSLRAHNV